MLHNRTLLKLLLVLKPLSCCSCCIPNYIRLVYLNVCYFWIILQTILGRIICCWGDLLHLQLPLIRQHSHILWPNLEWLRNRNRLLKLLLVLKPLLLKMLYANNIRLVYLNQILSDCSPNRILGRIICSWGTRICYIYFTNNRRHSSQPSKS
jgi:hypothetical protein